MKSLKPFDSTSLSILGPTLQAHRSRRYFSVGVRPGCPRPSWNRAWNRSEVVWLILTRGVWLMLMLQFRKCGLDWCRSYELPVHLAPTKRDNTERVCARRYSRMIMRHPVRGPAAVPVARLCRFAA